MRTKQAEARVVKASERTRETGQTLGMVREQAVRTDRLWAGGRAERGDGDVGVAPPW